ncbi:helix-turn-helix transcriptional regulator [uncultured Microbacterium sp.]|uniref:helix-turn-helix domain-containing protein n=1 Tax=uncultured Microbacterium sp. TaxID=191216 RepID=UPI0025E56E7F|nr:helix-turn-helix transcriptional regulator [uncultured Microbacterium sp.]
MARSTDRDREQARVALDATLVSVFSGDAADHLSRLQGMLDTVGADPDAAESRTRLAVAAAMAAVIACRFDVAADYAARAADAAVGLSAELTRMVGAVVLMTDAMAGTANASRRGITLPALLPGDSGPRRTSVRARRDDLLTRYLLAEAALSVAEFDVAEQLIEGAGLAPGQVSAPTGDGEPDAAGAPPARIDGAALTLQLLRARLSAFRGRAAQARVIGEGFAAAGVAVPERAFLVIDAIAAYGHAQAGDRRAFERAAAEVLARARDDANYLSVGSCLYVGWGMRTLGQLQASAALLTAIGGPGLARCKLWDRAFASEIIITAAAQRGDLLRAEELLAEATALSSHLVAASAVTRARGAIAAMRGRLEEARAHAVASVHLDEAVGSDIEALRGRHLHASLDPDTRRAAAALRRIASEADRLGIESVRALAARDWRRLSANDPSIVGDISVLSSREREIAALMAEGHSNPAIARLRFLSLGTVKSHAAEVLAVLGLRSRVHLAALLAPVGDEDAAAHLSPRQAQVARLIAAGLRNAEIASRLGLSERTVEKHVSAVLDRLDVTSRAAVAARVPHEAASREKDAASGEQHHSDAEDGAVHRTAAVGEPV